MVFTFYNGGGVSLELVHKARCPFQKGVTLVFSWQKPIEVIVKGMTTGELAEEGIRFSSRAFLLAGDP